ncbi:MAG: RecX family transcriptional regulator [Coriobacteriaceae bacterium]|nr:RecX family transcriptional regulator [Coriobacteriaceae bacterium]
MTELEVHLPDKGRASSSFSAKKPIAHVACHIDNGAVREIVVPVRVGRVLMNEGLPLPLPEEEAFDAIHAIEARVCFNLLTEMLSRRDYAIGEARSKLLDYGFRIEEVDPTLSRAVDLKFLNDERFASYFIDERKRRGWGRRKIELELKRRGVETSQLPGYPDEYFDEDDDLERARELLSRKSIPDGRAFDKLVRHLMSKGFSYSVAARAARDRINDDMDEDF